MKKYIFVVLFLAILAGGFDYFWQKRQAAAPNYVTTPVQRGDITQTVLANGVIAAAHTVDVGAQVSGKIERVHVELGDFVKKGQLLAEIDSTTQRNELATLRARLEMLEAQQRAAQVNLSTAKKQAERERRLYKQGSTSNEALENSENALAAAEAKLAENASQIKQTRISLDTAEANLGYTRIHSPFDGTIVALPIKEGQTVNASQTTPNIAKIADLTRMEIKLEIAEGDITKIKPGMKVLFSIFADPDHRRETAIDSIDPAFTSMSDGKTTTPSTTEAVYYYAKLLVDNPDQLLRVGMSTQNTIIISEAKGVLSVPNNALERVDGKYHVPLRLADGSASLRQVEIGLRDNLNTEITSGLQEGEEIIISGYSRPRELSRIERRRAGRATGG